MFGDGFPAAGAGVGLAGYAAVGDTSGSGGALPSALAPVVAGYGGGVEAVSASAAAPTIVSTTFGLLVAGRPVVTDFVALSEDKYLVQVPAPALVSDVALFLLPGNDFPAGSGITVMWAAPPFTEWATLGTLSAEVPSAVFRTGWSTNRELAGVDAVQIGLSVDPIDSVRNTSQALSSAEADRLAFVQLVARDLYRFLSSYATVTAVGERIVMPTDAVDKWLAKFEVKYRADPHFLLRSAAGE